MSDADRHWGHPVQARRWHVIEDGRSLCGGWAMPWIDPDADDAVDPDGDSYREGEDCKECCRRAGVLEVTDAE